MYLYSPQTQTILVVNYIISDFVASWNETFVFMKDWPIFFTGPLGAVLGKKISCGRNFLSEENFCNYLLKLCQINLCLYQKDNK